MSRVGDLVGVFFTLPEEGEPIWWLGWGEVTGIDLSPPDEVHSFGRQWDRVQLQEEPGLEVWTCEVCIVEPQRTRELLRAAPSVHGVSQDLFDEMRREIGGQAFPIVDHLLKGMT